MNSLNYNTNLSRNFRFSFTGAAVSCLSFCVSFFFRLPSFSTNDYNQIFLIIYFIFNLLAILEAAEVIFLQVLLPMDFSKMCRSSFDLANSASTLFACQIAFASLNVCKALCSMDVRYSLSGQTFPRK